MNVRIQERGSVSVVPKKKGLPTDATSRVRDAARRLLNEQYEGKQSAMAPDVGLTQGALSRFLSGGGTSLETAAAIARLLGVSLDALVGGEAPPPERIIERQDRYPNRVLAAQFARADGISEDAIERVGAMQLDYDGDPPPGEWYELMKAEARKARYAAKDPAGAQREVDIGASAARTTADEMERERDAARAAMRAKRAKERGE
jgi:transcriptional regulator with XRE-family HTH domain